jgi:hypothetical protein
MNKCLRIAKPQAAEVAFTSEAFPYDDNNCCAGPKCQKTGGGYQTRKGRGAGPRLD